MLGFSYAALSRRRDVRIVAMVVLVGGGISVGVGGHRGVLVYAGR